MHRDLRCFQSYVPESLVEQMQYYSKRSHAITDAQRKAAIKLVWALLDELHHEVAFPKKERLKRHVEEFYDERR